MSYSRYLTHFKALEFADFMVEYAFGSVNYDHKGFNSSVELVEGAYFNSIKPHLNLLVAPNVRPLIKDFVKQHPYSFLSGVSGRISWYSESNALYGFVKQLEDIVNEWGHKEYRNGRRK